MSQLYVNALSEKRTFKADTNFPVEMEPGAIPNSSDMATRTAGAV